ncbi:ABC transporter permease subunit [Berryella wangjianweii]|uniref:ABC transporter permease subunit n=1 Tax=Berryella wangjianweii TaxID=2734634 RepID=A0A6M8J7A3_9ACTN|nr:ABC transporter permease subunit [Berryella wangjianweii]QKF07498.1 ABC transporter permease subunit [Berryella wangjianweii]
MTREPLKKAGGYAFALAFIVACWWLSSLALQSPALPSPAQTVPVLSAHLGALAPDFLVSSYRVVVSVLLGTACAVPLALACSRSRRIDALFAPVLYLLYPIPKVVLLPILLVLLGLADAPKIALISLTVFFQVLVAVRDAVRALPEDALLSIRVLGAGRVDEYRHVVLPATLPAVLTSLRISVGTAIAVLFIAEAIAGSSGLGYFIMHSWGMVNYPRMFAGIIALAGMGVVLYAAFDLVERRLLRWRG